MFNAYIEEQGQKVKAKSKRLQPVRRIAYQDRVHGAFLMLRYCASYLSKLDRSKPLTISQAISMLKAGYEFVIADEETKVVIID